MPYADNHKFSLRKLVRYHLLEKKLNTFPGFFLLGLLAIGVGYTSGAVDVKIGPALVAGTAMIIAVITLVRNPTFGFYFLIAFSAFTSLIDRLVTLPLPSGTFIDIITYILLLTILLNYDLKSKIDGKFWTNPISIGIYITFAYYLIEMFNTDMFSKLGWFSYFRKQISYVVIYYVSYTILDSKKKIIYFVRFMIVLTTLTAIYACKQQYLGYAGFEMRSIGPRGMALLFQGGLLRKFSVYGDPATSGILFASVTMLALILMIRSSNIVEKRWLGVAVVFNLMGYSFSGTRTATLMVAAGIALYCLVTLYEKRSLIFLMVCLGIFGAFMVLPFNNIVTNRIRSTFNGAKDASAAIRDYDRHQVQPYIQDHPLGGGIFTCGVEGPKYNPGHYLEMFQPDSGYMKVLAEQGPVGFLVMLVFYFIIMQHGFRHFYKVRDPEIQNYYIALLIMMFTILIAQYAQITLAQYPISLFFFVTLVIFIKLADYDTPSPPKSIQN